MAGQDGAVILLGCGGRDFQDYSLVESTLNSLHQLNPVKKVIHGGARGADSLVGRWASSHKIEIVVYPALWKIHGKSAGPIRNQQMLDSENITTAVAFPGGRGTADMVKRLTKANIPVQIL